jgi:hypothetical protein
MSDDVYFASLYGLAIVLVLILAWCGFMSFWKNRRPELTSVQGTATPAFLLYGLGVSLVSWTGGVLPWEMLVALWKEDYTPSYAPGPGSWSYIVLWYVYPLGTAIAWWAWFKARRHVARLGLTPNQKQATVEAVVWTCWLWCVLALLPLLIRLPAATFEIMLDAFR